MITTGPFTLTLDVDLSLPDPGLGSNNPSVAVQFQNASPFVVNVNSGGTVYTVQSFTAQTITAAGSQPLSVEPISSNLASVTTSASSLIVVWLLAGESPPMADGPLTAAAIAALSGVITSQGATDLLETTTGTVLNPSATFTTTALHNYQSFEIFITPNFGGVVLVEVTDTTTGTEDSQTLGVGSGGTYRYLLAVPANTGDTVVLTVTAMAGGGAGSTANIQMIGTTGTLGLVVRPFQGVPLVTSQVGGTSVVSVTASDGAAHGISGSPPIGTVLRAWSLVATGAKTSVLLIGTTTATLYGAAPSVTGGLGVAPGQLVTEGLSVQAPGASTTWTVSLTYDLVFTPNFIG